MNVSFFVPGAPIAKGRPRFARFGKFVKTYTPKKTHDYESIVSIYAKRAGLKYDARPVSVQLHFFFSTPKSTKGRNGKPHCMRPDIDNLIKSVMDGLKCAWIDDAQVFQILASKQWCNTEQPEGVSVFLTYSENNC